MISKEDIESRKINLRKLHDKIKLSPYWLNFDNMFIPELSKDFLELSENIYGTFDETNPYYVVLRACNHEFHCMVRNLSAYIENGMFARYKSAYIITMQTFLQNVHCMIDGNTPQEQVIGFLPNYDRSNDKNLITITAEWFEDENKYRALNIINKKSVEKVKNYVTALSTAIPESYTAQWANECLKDIEEGNTIIGKHWKIK